MRKDGEMDGVGGGGGGAVFVKLGGQTGRGGGWVRGWGSGG